MKKILVALTALLATLSLAGCTGTKDGGVAANIEVDYNRDHAHIQLSDNTLAHRDVVCYKCNDTIIHINLKNYGWITVDSKNVVLYNGNTCPVCRY